MADNRKIEADLADLEGIVANLNKAEQHRLAFDEQEELVLRSEKSRKKETTQETDPLLALPKSCTMLLDLLESSDSDSDGWDGHGDGKDGSGKCYGKDG